MAASTVNALGRFDALHQARVKGVLKPDGATSGTELADLVDAGYLNETRVGYVLTPSGFARHAEYLEDVRHRIDLRVIEKTYDRFLAVNVPIKAECSRWQTLDRNAESAFLVSEELRVLFDRVAPMLTRAGKELPQFHNYRERLQKALDLVRDGNQDYLTAPDKDSFHTVWFECHEDYLLTLGRSREEEGSF